MKKTAISKLFLYRHRFVIGYVLLSLAFVALLFALPVISQSGISDAEMKSAVNSYSLGQGDIMSWSLVDLPYHLLQKYSIMLFGLTAYAIKLPSILIGLLLGLLLILLLNRWFKNNVSLLASCLIVLSTPFLFLAGSGTPLIMLVFWPTLLFWLGSKIQGEKRPRPIYSLLFTLAMIVSVFTPYMVYFAIFCGAFVFIQPHLRFVVKNLPKSILALMSLCVIAIISVLGINISQNPDVAKELLLAKDFHITDLIGNIAAGLSPAFSWRNSTESTLLSPLISLPVFALALIGLFSTTKGFFASRNSIASLLLVFCLIITGFNPLAIVFIILPLSILVAHGLRYLLEKWYGLFPENPYARISALFPLTILFGVMIIPGLLQYVYGYRYNPNVAAQFSDVLEIINHNDLNDRTLIVTENYDFYKILEDSSNIRVTQSLPNDTKQIAVLGKLGDDQAVNYQIDRIITSPMRDNSDIMYLYTFIDKPEGE